MSEDRLLLRRKRLTLIDLILWLYLRLFNDIGLTHGRTMLNNELEKCGKKRLVQGPYRRQAAEHDVLSEIRRIKIAMMHT